MKPSERLVRWIDGEEEELTGGKLYHAYVPCWSPMGDWIVMTVHEYGEIGHAILAFQLSTKRYVFSRIVASTVVALICRGMASIFAGILTIFR